MTNILNEIRKELAANSDPEIQDGTKRYFKESIKCYGIRNATVTSIGKKYFKSVKSLAKPEVFEFCNDLWNSGMIEESFIASHWSYSLRKKYEPSDFEIFENWISNNISNWASCDGFCNHTIGEFIEMYPEFLFRLKIWASSDNRWERRASAVSMIVPARRGKFLNDIFEIADLLLLDKDDLVQKGYGWMLKVASQIHQKEVFDFLMIRKTRMPRTALRYALEKMPLEMRAIAMIK